MHPLLLHRRGLVVYLLAWLVAGALLASAPWAAGQASLGRALLFVLPLALVYGCISLGTFYACRALPLRGAGLSRLLVIHLTSALVASSFWVGLSALWGRVLGVKEGGTSPYLFAAGTLLYMLAVAVHYLMIALEEARAVERRALRLQVDAREAELRALRAQINPHFLFNSLNSVAALTTADPAGARRMCLLLADYLRLTVRLGSRDVVPLAEELALLAHYLEIERVRFGARLQVSEEVTDEARGCLVPALLLQPLVENAIRHGIAELVDGGEVRVEARVAAGSLCVAMANPCDPDRRHRSGEGVGLANVRRRVETAFGDDARVTEEERDGVFRVEVRLPARRREPETGEERRA